MRRLSPRFRRAVFAPSDAETAVALMTMEAQGLAEPLRLANDVNPAGEVMSRGLRYACLPFRVTLGADDADKAARVRLEMDGLGAGGEPLVAQLRQLLAMGGVRVTLELALAATPDVVELGPVRATMLSAEYGLDSITATLGPDAALEEDWPSERFTPSSHGALF